MHVLVGKTVSQTQALNRNFFDCSSIIRNRLEKPENDICVINKFLFKKMNRSKQQSKTIKEKC